jgi:anti-sigma-K factor RskA
MHVDPEILALLALGEQAADTEAQIHLASCSDCRAELAHLSRAATLGRSTLGAGELLIPDARVWSRVTEELGIRAVAGPAPDELDESRTTGAHRAGLRRPRRLGRRRWLPVAVAASLVVVLGLGAVFAWQRLQPGASDVLASATLKAFPDWKGSTGEARIEKRSDGSRVVQVSLRSPEHRAGFDEVWLISSDASQLVSLGVLDDGSGTFTIPAGIDLGHYDLVDISSEPLDGNPAHSANSIVRGQLS